MIIREIGASLRALFARLSSKTATIAGTENLYLDDAGSSVKATLSDAIRYGGGNSTRVTTIGNANIHQSNTGALWLEVTGQTAGNARGAGSFDWQATRGNAARVASGAGAIAMGAECTASGNYSFAFGSGCVASGIQSFSLGNSCNATSTYAIAMGNACTASAIESIAFGARAISGNLSQFSLGSSPLTVGGGQVSIQPFYTETTDASATVLSIRNSASSRMVIPAMRACAITGLVTAMSDATDGYKVKAWEIKAVITRDNSNNTRIVGTPVITELGADTEAAGWAITSITADNTNESLAITVTGETATNIRWQSSLFYSQVGH